MSLKEIDPWKVPVNSSFFRTFLLHKNEVFHSQGFFSIRIWSYLLKKSFTENFIFYAVFCEQVTAFSHWLFS